jgi:HEAT repeat protein
LVEVLKGEEVSVSVRRNTAEALGLIGDSKAIEALVDVLEGGHEDVGGAAAEALGRIGDSKAIEALIVALMDEAEDVGGACNPIVRKNC